MEPGRIIADKYRLTREIGQGGMGSVWAAVHEALGRTVAVKFLRPQVSNDPSLAERFVSEARTVASIKHRFVVDVFDFGVTDDGLYYMVLEFLEGVSLAKRIDDGPAFSAKEAMHLVADCLRGLHAVHEAGVVHRDLKPENIFVIQDADGTFPKLIDFGISKKSEDTGVLGAADGPEGQQNRLTQPGMIVGTPWYMSPEQLRGRNNLDRRCDIYSMGVILYTLLAGRLPFNQDNIGDLMVAITTQGPTPLASLRPELGQGLSDVVARALAAKPESRFASALELRDTLLSLVPTLGNASTEVAHAPPPVTAYGKHTELQLRAASDPFADSAQEAESAERSRKRMRLALAAGAALIVVVVIVALMATSSSSKPAAANADQPVQIVPAATPPPSAASVRPTPTTGPVPSTPDPSTPTVATPRAAAQPTPSAQPATTAPAPRAAVRTDKAIGAAHAAVTTGTPASSTQSSHAATTRAAIGGGKSHAPSAAPKKSSEASTPKKKIYHQLDF